MDLVFNVWGSNISNYLRTNVHSLFICLNENRRWEIEFFRNDFHSQWDGKTKRICSYADFYINKVSSIRKRCLYESRGGGESYHSVRVLCLLSHNVSVREFVLRSSQVDVWWSQISRARDTCGGCRPPAPRRRRRAKRCTSTSCSRRSTSRRPASRHIPSPASGSARGGAAVARRPRPQRSRPEAQRSPLPPATRKRMNALRIKLMYWCIASRVCEVESRKSVKSKVDLNRLYCKYIRAEV